MSPSYGTAEQQAADSLLQRLFYEAVAEVTERAKTALPECHSRIEQAVQLVHASKVEGLANGTIQVRYPEQEDSMYPVQDACLCPESEQAPRGWCVHRLAAAITRRAVELTQTRLALGEPPSPSEPVAAAEAVATEDLVGATIPSQYIQHMHGKPFVRYAGLLAMAHERGLQQLEATFIRISDTFAVAQATAVFTDGRRFTESGDATPENVHFEVRPHFARLALTRAKARALRDALNIGMCAVEELA
jgi:hypothetical protein